MRPARFSPFPPWVVSPLRAAVPTRVAAPLGAALALVIALAAESATALASTGPIEVRPPTPRPTDVFEVVATYATSCPFERLDTRVEGRELRLTAVDGCVCLPGLPTPRTVSSFFGPLAPGLHTVRFLVAHEEQGVACGEPQPVADEGFEVRQEGGPGRLAIEPPRPTSDEPVRLTVRSECPAQTRAEPPQIADRTITLIERYNPAILAPCRESPVDVGGFTIGPLAAGVYTLRLFTVEVDLLGNGTIPEAPTLEAELTVSEPARLSLADGRFLVEATWEDPQGGGGAGQPVRLTGDTGTFWFFDPDNVEVVVKVLDACAVNGRFWVFAAGLTDLHVELTVVDTEGDVSRTYLNPQGHPFEPVQDTDFFATCPASP